MGAPFCSFQIYKKTFLWFLLGILGSLSPLPEVELLSLSAFYHSGHANMNWSSQQSRSLLLSFNHTAAPHPSDTLKLGGCCWRCTVTLSNKTPIYCNFVMLYINIYTQTYIHKIYLKIVNIQKIIVIALNCTRIWMVLWFYIQLLGKVRELNI